MRQIITCSERTTLPFSSYLQVLQATLIAINLLIQLLVQKQEHVGGGGGGVFPTQILAFYCQSRAEKGIFLRLGHALYPNVVHFVKHILKYKKKGNFECAISI